jgi:thioredoxin
MSQPVIEVGLANFKAEVLQSAVPVIVDFWAPWCGPCRTLGPRLDALASSRAGAVKVAKVNVDQESALANGFQVRGIPMLLFIKDGQVVDQAVGVLSPADLASRVDRMIGA